MPKSRPHDIDRARDEHYKIVALATKLHEPFTSPWCAECVIRDLKNTADFGLIDCYGNFLEFFHDVVASVPEIGADGYCNMIYFILTDERYQELRKTILAYHRFDLDRAFAAEIEMTNDPDLN